MQDVNNDMDDLFRKAAEQYPLQTDGADWQKVFAGLQNASLPVAEEKEKKRRFLWLFLFLPLGLLWAVHYKGDNRPEQQATLVKENGKHGNNNLKKPDFTFNKKSSSESVSSNDIRLKLSSGEVNGNQKKAIVSDDKALIASAGKEGVSQKSKPDIHAISSAFLKNKREEFSYKGATSDDDVRPLNDTIDNQVNNHKNNLSGTQPDALASRIDKADEQSSGKQTVDETIQAKTDSVISVNAKADSAANNTSNANKSKPVKAKPRTQTGFYAGLLGSFDASTVRLQRITKTGYGLQVVAGYRFSNRISIESGLGGTVKRYYSTGKYFDKKKTGIPDVVNIYYTNGYCKMFEVPLNVKYDFASTRKSNLLVTTGFSSYFMKKEDYSYRGDYMGWVYDTTRYYNNSGANWFSLVNVSIGYEARLSRNSSLRIEPYIKVPLHGIGIAGLPITSMGISAGFTRKF